MVFFLILSSVAIFSLGNVNGDSLVTEFTKSTLDETSFEYELTCIVFVKSGCQKCPNVLSLVEESAEILKGIVKFLKVDATSKCPICNSLKVSTFPNIKIFSKNSNKFSDYKDKHDVRTFVNKLKNIIDKHIEEELDSRGHKKPSTYVIELSDSNFTSNVQNSDMHWLVEFYAPWCGHCKALAPTYKQAAEKLHGKMNLGAVDATVNTQLASKFNIKGFPTLKFFPSKTKDFSTKFEDYNAGRDLDSIVDWANIKIRTLLPPAEFVQITDDGVLDDNCRQKSLCFIAFLPDFEDSSKAEWNSYLKTLQEVAGTYKDPWGWVWTEAGVYEDLEKAVGVGEYGYPSMVVVNPSKKVYSTLRNAFDVKGIKDFIASLNARHATTSALDYELPSVGNSKRWPDDYLRNEEL